MAALLLVQNLYKSVKGQEKVIEEQQTDIDFLHEANTLIDVEEATGVAMKDEHAELTTSQSMLKDLKTRLSEAIAALRAAEPEGSTGEPWTEESTELESSSELGDGSPESTSTLHNTKPNADAFIDLQDPAVGNSARWERQWHSWLAAPTADPVNLVIDPIPVILDREDFKAAREEARRKRFDPVQFPLPNEAAVAAEDGSEASILDESWWTSGKGRIALMNPSHASSQSYLFPSIPNPHGVYPEPDRPFRWNIGKARGMVVDRAFRPDFWSTQLQGRDDIWSSSSEVDATKRSFDRLEEAISPKSSPPHWSQPGMSFAAAVAREPVRQAATPYRGSQRDTPYWDMDYAKPPWSFR